jgi:crotonobetainyl-CoA:carnitine CoA-transferase CaiB-like acyl-CoA transferase
MSGICAGLGVIEMGAGSIAASIAGMVLADAGARVIKLEPPEGDRLRTAMPSGFLVWNRGKESLVADLRTAAGQQQLRELGGTADVIIEGFSPGTTAAWGVDADVLCAANPRLVHCGITGFGTTGPYSRLKGYDALVCAKAGLFARGGYGHREGAIFYPVSWGSFGAALESAAGILAALLVRDQTGLGQKIDATMLSGIEPVEYLVSIISQLRVKRGQEPAIDARSGVPGSRYGVLVATRDGRFIQTSTMLPHQARALSAVAGLEHTFDDPRFAAQPVFGSAEDAQAWEDLLWEAFRSDDLAYWLPRLEASPDVAFEVSRTSEEGLDHPQIIHNGDVITVSDPRHGPVREVGPIAHFSDSPCRVERSAPALGANQGPFAGPVPESHRSPAPVPPLAAPAHPLAGVTIVEFGCYYAVPYGLAMTAALGARVIKIEDRKGDPHRMAFGPEVASMKTTRGKESVSIDLQSEQGRSVAHRIISEADVFVTGFRSRVADKLGLGYDELKEINPGLIYVHAAGYGTDGPYAKRALYAQAAQTVAGSFGRQVGFWTSPELNLGMSVPELRAVVAPRLNQIVDGDSNAALAAAVAVVLAVFHQRRTGRGQFVRTSMISGNAWCYADDFCSYAGKPEVAVCDDDYFGLSATERVYPAAEGWVCLVVRTEREWQAFTDAIGRTELATNPRYATVDARQANDGELIRILGGRFAEQPSTVWEELLSQADVGCVDVGLAGHPAFISFDQGLREAGLTTEIEHPRFGPMVVWAPHLRFSKTPSRLGRSCERGEHNRPILAEAGYSSAEIDRLEAGGVVVPPDAMVRLAADDPGLRAGVITGTREVFSAGSDLAAGPRLRL